MKKRLVRISLAVFLGLGLILGTILVLTQVLVYKQTFYDDKPVFFWIVQLTNQDLTVSNHARIVLNQQIIPHLTNVMFNDTNDSALKFELIEKLNTLPYVNIFYTTASTRRGDAATMLGEFGTAARAAIPSLLQALKGQDLVVRRAAAVSLGKIHAEPEIIIPLLITFLDDQSMNEAAADGLGEYGPPAKASISKLMALSTVRNKDLHHAVLEALMKIDPDAAAEARGR